MDQVIPIVIALLVAGIVAALFRVMRQLQRVRRNQCQLQQTATDTYNRARAISEILLEEQWQKRVLENPRYQNPLNLLRHSWQVNSQGAEDGILAEIFRRIGTTNRFFIEIGIDEQLENNTTFLLAQGWSGVWLDGNQKGIDLCLAACAAPVREGRLRGATKFLQRENINEIIRSFTPPAEPDLFSLDIDRNTYWVWDGLDAIRPRVVLIEYNAQFGPSLDWKVAYEPSAVFDRSINFGASLKAMELLGRAKGYSLVGCDYRGFNAFFVRAELAAGKFHEPFTSETHFEPVRWHALRQPPHARAYCGTEARSKDS